MKTKKTPMRMCVGCRQMRPKKELLRVVRSMNEQLCIDKTGKMPGRGAYICPDKLCLERAVKNRGIERGLGFAAGASIKAELLSQIEDCDG